MSNTKLIRYNLDPIDKIGARFNVIYGERSNGKSYQVKHKKGVEKFIKTKKRFILMRRWKDEIQTSQIEQYFQDVDVEKLTNGVFNCISMYRRRLYLSYYDSILNKVKRGDHCGYAVALSQEQNYAGVSYLDVEDIIFEEFMSRSLYIAREPTKLMNFYATVDRKRLTTKIWLVGNTISRVCPYLREWDLQNIVANQKQGTIQVKSILNPETQEKIDIAIEYCKSTGQSSGTIGTNAKMINTGSWDSIPQPKLPKSYNKYEKLYTIGFQFQGFKFLGELISDNENVIWFIKPYMKEFNEDTLIFSDEIKPEINWQRNIYDITIPNKDLWNLLQSFREDKIFYSSDLCGTDFKQAIDFSIRR